MVHVGGRSPPHVPGRFALNPEIPSLLRGFLSVSWEPEKMLQVREARVLGNGVELNFTCGYTYRGVLKPIRSGGGTGEGVGHWGACLEMLVYFRAGFNILVSSHHGSGQG